MSATTGKKANRQLILQALTDPKFRKQLADDPEAALGSGKLSEARRREVALVLATVKGIQAQISAVGDQLLCANGGCGIAKA